MERFKRLAGYGAGAFALQIVTGTLSSFLMLFHGNVLGITAMTSGTIFLVTRVLDAFADLYMARLASRTRSRWGTYRPYLLIGAVPIGVAFYFCFAAPAGLSPTQKIGWAIVTYALAGGVFATLCGVPYGSLNSVMSTRPHDRSTFAASRSIGENIASMAMFLATLPIVLHFGAISSPEGWQVVGALYGFLGAAGFLLCFGGTSETAAPRAVERTSLTGQFAILRGNTPLIGCIMIVFFFVMLATYFGIFSAYFCIYTLGHPEWASSLMGISFATSLLVAGVVPRLSTVLERRHIITLGGTVAIAGFVIMYFVTSFTSLVIAQIIYGLGFGAIITTIWAVIPEVADYGEWKTGTSSPAFVYALVMFALKVCSGLANYAVGVCLTLAGYDASLTVQSASTAEAIRVGTTLGPIVLAGAVILSAMLLRSVDRAAMEAVRRSLSARS